jgi:peptidyl-prolyl cis-trans isomerase D
VLLSRASAQSQPRALVDAVLRADAAKLPQWLGVDLGDAGYAVVRLTAIKPPAADAPELTQLLPRYAQAWGAAEGQAYYGALKSRFKAEIEADTLAATASAPAK